MLLLLLLTAFSDNVTSFIEDVDKSRDVDLAPSHPNVSAAAAAAAGGGEAARSTGGADVDDGDDNNESSSRNMYIE